MAPARTSLGAPLTMVTTFSMEKGSLLSVCR
jgi:hypothetical protein